MVELLYSLLLVGTSGGVGLAAVVGWLNWKVYRMDHARSRKANGLLLVGIMFQNGVLTYALIDAGTTQLNWRSVLYSIALVVSTVALGWRAGQLASTLALREIVSEGNGDWLQSIEKRLTAEEARNTDIEVAARRALLRADEAEKRADAAEEREIDE